MTNTWRVGRFALLLVLLAALVAAGCGDSDSDSDGNAADSGASTTSDASDADSNETKTVNLGIGVAQAFTFTLPEYAAREQGYFDEAGLDVKVTTFQSGADAVKAIASGDLDMAITTGFDPPAAVSKGVPLKVVAGVSGKNPSLLVAKDGSGLDSIEDLAGKKIGLTRFGSITEWEIRTFAEKAGVDIDDITMVPVGFTAAPAAIQKGNIDGFFFGPEQFYTLQADGGVHSVAAVADIAPDDQFTAVSASTKFLEEQPETVKTFLDAYIKGVRKIAEDEDYALKAIESQLKMDPDLAKKSWDAYAPTLQTDGVMSIAGLEAYANALPELGLSDNAPTAEEMVTEEFVPVDSN